MRNKSGKILVYIGSVICAISFMWFLTPYIIVEPTKYQKSDMSIIDVAGIITGISVGTALIFIGKMADRILPNKK